MTDADDSADVGSRTTECPECGGTVSLDDVYEAGECPHCGYSGEPAD